MTLEEAEFKDWMIKLNFALERRCGMTSHDLPDRDYYSLFLCGDDLDDVVTEILEEEGFRD